MKALARPLDSYPRQKFTVNSLIRQLTVN